MPATYYSTVLPGAKGGPSIQATFVDENPFIIAYNATTNKYHSPYYVAHVCPSSDACWSQGGLCCCKPMQQLLRRIPSCNCFLFHRCNADKHG